MEETVLNAAHLEESLLVLVFLDDYLQDTLVHYLSRHLLHLRRTSSRMPVVYLPGYLVVHDHIQRGVGGVPVDGEYLARETVIDWAQSSE